MLTIESLKRVLVRVFRKGVLNLSLTSACSTLFNLPKASKTFEHFGASRCSDEEESVADTELVGLSDPRAAPETPRWPWNPASAERWRGRDV